MLLALMSESEFSFLVPGMLCTHGTRPKAIECLQNNGHS